MAKKKSGSPPAPKAAAPQAAPPTATPRPSDPRLARALETFQRGDYVQARALLAPLVSDPTLAEGERKLAAARIESARLDPVVVRTALAGLALILLAITLTSLIQP